MSSEPRYCRDQARHCADMSAVTKDPELRGMLTDLAVGWLQLAQHLEVHANLEINKE